MSAKPKIAILSNYPWWLHVPSEPPRKGHYGVWHVAMHEAMANSPDFEIHRVVLDNSVKKELTFTDKGTIFHVLPCTKKTIGLYTRYIWDRWQVARCLKKIKPDLVHAWGTEDCYGLCGCDFKGKKMFSVQGLLTAYSQRAKIAKFEIKQSRYEKKVLNSYPLITTESEWAKERVLELAPNAVIDVWDYAVEERFFKVQREIQSTPSLVIAGSNTPVKNVKLAITIFSRESLRDIELIMAGVGTHEYENLPDNIKPIGRVSRDEMVSLLQKTWGLFHPSLADTGPTILKEARVMGVPCVVSHDCGAKQYVIQGKSGFVTEPNNIEQFEQAVLELVESKERNIAMGAFDQERCREALSDRVMVDKITHIYNKLLSE